MRLEVEIREEPMDGLAEHALISIAFRIDRVLQVDFGPSAPGGARLTEVPHEPARIKDYDAIPGNHPTDWLADFDTSGWGLISACVEGRRVGGIVIASRFYEAHGFLLAEVDPHAYPDLPGEIQLIWRKKLA